MTLYSFDSVIFYSFNNKAVNICKDLILQCLFNKMLSKIGEYSLKVSSFLVYQILKNLHIMDKIVLAKITCPISQGNIMVLPNLINNISVKENGTSRVSYLSYQLVLAYPGEIDFATPFLLVFAASNEIIQQGYGFLNRYLQMEEELEKK